MGTKCKDRRSYGVTFYETSRKMFLKDERRNTTTKTKKQPQVLSIKFQHLKSWAPSFNSIFREHLKLCYFLYFFSLIRLKTFFSFAVLKWSYLEGRDLLQWNCVCPSGGKKLEYVEEECLSNILSQKPLAKENKTSENGEKRKVFFLLL